MRHGGYHWTIRPSGPVWLWEVRGHDDGALLLEGLAPSRAVAAAFVVRTLARAASEPVGLRELAA